MLRDRITVQGNTGVNGNGGGVCVRRSALAGIASPGYLNVGAIYDDTALLGGGLALKIPPKPANVALRRGNCRKIISIALSGVNLVGRENPPRQQCPAGFIIAMDGMYASNAGRLHGCRR